MNPLDLIWIFFIFSSLQPAMQQRLLAYQRAQALQALQKRNGSRALTLLHRREGFAFLGIPRRPGPGGGADRTRSRRPSAAGHGVRPSLRHERGTLIALAADEIVMAPSAVSAPSIPRSATCRRRRSSPRWRRRTSTKLTTRP